MSNLTDDSRRVLLERFVSVVNFWADNTDLYNLNTEEQAFQMIPIAHQITGLWYGCLSEILFTLNYTDSSNNFPRDCDPSEKISYFIAICLTVSFNCCPNHGNTLRNICRILFRVL